MKHRIRNSVALLIVPCFLLLGATDANAGISKGVKIGVGIGLLAGGFALGAHSLNRLFQETSKDEVALVMIAAGTTFLIIGLTEKKKPDDDATKFRNGLVSRSTMEISFGAAPIKKGWAAGARIRW